MTEDITFFCARGPNITLLSPGKGARRRFDPASVQITWHQPGAEDGARETAG